MNTTRELLMNRKVHSISYFANVGSFDIFTAADLWGKIPYSQAANPEYAQPKFDSQEKYILLFWI